MGTHSCSHCIWRGGSNKTQRRTLLIDSLDSINLSFKENFAKVFKKPELIQPFLTKRAKKFDEIIKKEFLRRKLETDFAIVALGGYGRKDLFPSADIDLSIIQFNQKTKKIEDIKDFLGWLWTLKVKVGHSVRTIKDIEEITKSDLKEFTSYLSYRIIFCKKDKIASLNDDLKKVSKKWNKLSFLRLSKLSKIKDFNLLIQLNSALSQISKSLQVACEIFKLLFGYWNIALKLKNYKIV